MYLKIFLHIYQNAKQVESYKSICDFIEKYGNPSKEMSNCVNEPFFSKNEEKESKKVNNYKMTETNNILII